MSTCRLRATGIIKSLPVYRVLLWPPNVSRCGTSSCVLDVTQEKGGEDKLKELAAGLKGSDFLEADPELDPPDLPSVPDFLAAEGLTALAA